MRKLFAAAVVLGLAAPAAWAYGPHDPNCVECHSIHYAKGKAILAVAPNTKEKNPATGKGAEGDAALCLGCHNEDEGIVPIHLAQTHPVGMKPNKVKVPAELLRKDGTLGCTSCHDPHPSNPNYKYLRGTVAKGSELGKFCALCHGDKADMGAFAKAPAKKK
ncbi:cytochrome c3 family protein [Deferrisoma palaeochoriense]